MKRKIFIAIFVALVIALGTIGIVECCAPRCDYKSAEKLEADLNAGENVVGKTAKIRVDNIVDDAFFGLCTNYWAGEHLNLLTDESYDIDVGDTIYIHVIEYSQFGDRHLIYFDLVR